MKLICNECGHNSTKNINIWIFKNLICGNCSSDNVSIYLGNIEILHKNSPRCHYPECDNFLPLPWIEKGNKDTGLGTYQENTFMMNNQKVWMSSMNLPIKLQ